MSELHIVAGDFECFSDRVGVAGDDLSRLCLEDAARDISEGMPGSASASQAVDVNEWLGQGVDALVGELGRFSSDVLAALRHAQEVEESVASVFSAVDPSVVVAVSSVGVSALFDDLARRLGGQ